MGASGFSRLRGPVLRLGHRLPRQARVVARPLARRLHLAPPEDMWWLAARPPWNEPTAEEEAAVVRCNVCRWTGDRFLGDAHCEGATCPRCGSIARDRFLLWCFFERRMDLGGQRVLETSPRLGEQYRSSMRNWFDYRASDYDLGSHIADVQLDLQDIALPEESVDVVLTPHVLEHVPDTDRAIHELHRVIAPGGVMYLQIPLLHGRTAVPREPEFHADNTLVYFNFGWDLTDRLRAVGFNVDVLVTDEYRCWLAGDRPAPASNGDGFVVESLVADARASDLIAVAGDDDARRLGFVPAYHFVTWECRRS